MKFRVLLLMFIIALTVFCGCNSEQNINENVLPKDEMTSIIVELELVQAAFKVETQDNKFNLDKLTNTIFENHHTTKQQFDESVLYYSKYPEEMENIYNDVISSISSKQVEN